MTSIRYMNEKPATGGANLPLALRRIDMNLLVVFVALVRERSVTQAGLSLGLTQPAVSNALNRLRQLLQDPLFVRSGNGIIPTSRALELARPITEAMWLIEQAVTPTKFDPLSDERAFQVGLSDSATLTILPGLIELFAKIAPGISVQAQSKGLPSPPGVPEEERVDVTIGIFPEVPSSCNSTVLFRDSYACLMRRDHPFATGALTLERLATARHVSLRPVPQAMIDTMLMRRNLSRRVVATVNQTAVLPRIIESTDLVACVLESASGSLVNLAERGIVKRPVDIEPFDIELVWHVASETDAANRWLRERILGIVKQRHGS